LLHWNIATLTLEFSMKHLSHLHPFLGMSVTHTLANLFLSQRRHA
jgi:hypothetical protein